jgi:hypothetical protein
MSPNGRQTTSISYSLHAIASPSLIKTIVPYVTLGVARTRLRTSAHASRAARADIHILQVG